MSSNKFKYFGDDYLATTDLIDSLPPDILEAFRLHGILRFQNIDQAYYFMMGNYERYRSILENYVLWDFVGKFPEYEEVIIKNKGFDPKLFNKPKEQSNVYG